MGDYEKYLETFEWKVRRLRAIRDAGDKCQRCGRDKGLEAHHLRYTNLGNEPPEDLIVLCTICHMREHDDPNSKSNRRRAGYKKVLEKWAWRKYGRSFDGLGPNIQAEIETELRQFLSLKGKR
jgi:5-methylcytosine-specific restriction endonuclease McrA